SSVSVEIWASDEIHMSIEDNGRGLTPAGGDGARTFGLDGMRERARSIGGHLVVSSAAGSGTSVFLHVPRAAGETDGRQPAAVRARAAQVLRVVVVDDHPAFREGVRQLLESRRDIRVVGSAATAGDGLACVRQERPDVVLVG